ncbi:hypothetical protein CLU79DRAFT_743050 [Phycomyces nitens]|nr:hypothetical protein CLU79DRAFT_743050 [Phycomyces nitens]
MTIIKDEHSNDTSLKHNRDSSVGQSLFFRAQRSRYRHNRQRWKPSGMPDQPGVWSDYVAKSICPDDSLWTECLIDGGIPTPWRGLVWQAILCMPAPLTALFDQWVAIHRPLQPQTSLERLRDALTDQLGHLSAQSQIIVEFLSTVVSEKEAFCVFVRWMETENLQLLSSDSLALKERLGLLNSVLAQMCPILHQHLALHNVQLHMYAGSWYQTLMCDILPHEYALRALDLFLLQGSVYGVTQMAMAILQRNQETLLAIQDHNQLLDLLTSKQLNTYDSPDNLIKHSLALCATFTPAAMDRLKVPLISHDPVQTLSIESSTPIYHVNASIPNTVDLLSKSQVGMVLDSPISGPLSNRSSLFTLSQKSCGTYQTAETLADYDHGFNGQEELGTWDASLGQATSELVDIKLANFEMSQKYETLCHAHQHVLHQLDLHKEVDRSLADKTQLLETGIKLIKEENAKSLEENDALARQGQDLEKQVAVAQAMAAELSLERDGIADKVEKLTSQVASLEEEKTRYYVPSTTMTLLGETKETGFCRGTVSRKEQGRRYTLSQMSTRVGTGLIDEEARYVQSELRCRELEKMLAETKVQLAAQEAEVKTYSLTPRKTVPLTGSLFLSKRTSINFPTRPMSVQYEKPARPFTLPAIKRIPADRSLILERHDVYQGR